MPYMPISWGGFGGQCRHIWQSQTGCVWVTSFFLKRSVTVSHSGAEQTGGPHTPHCPHIPPPTHRSRTCPLFQQRATPTDADRRRGGSGHHQISPGRGALSRFSRFLKGGASDVDGCFVWFLKPRTFKVVTENWESVYVLFFGLLKGYSIGFGTEPSGSAWVGGFFLAAAAPEAGCFVPSAQHLARSLGLSWVTRV